MSSDRYIEVDGQRINIDDYPVLTEHRCDADGEYVATRERLYLYGQMIGSTGPPMHFAFDLHPGCLPRAGEVIQRQRQKLLADLTPAAIPEV